MKTLRILLLAVVLWSMPAAAQRPAPQAEEVKNVVLMIGDGMGLGQVASLMIEEGYAPLSFDRAPYTAICKTYSANNRVTDSAASATAMATGCKTDNSRVGLLPDSTKVVNLTELAKEKGLATGIVVTSHLVDATPAGFSAHNLFRYNNEPIAADVAALQPDIIAGGGRDYFTKREDGRDLVAELKQHGYSYAATPEEFYETRRLPVVGLFAEKYMDKAPARGEDYLARATRHALELLNATDKGFFAMIEGSQIDKACHENDTPWMLAEMREFDSAVNTAFDFADSHPGTLVIVVADHETGGLTITANKGDFTASESGVVYNYSTRSHSGTPVVLFAYGAGAYNFSGVMENIDIFHRIKALLLDSKE